MEVTKRAEWMVDDWLLLGLVVVLVLASALSLAECSDACAEDLPGLGAAVQELQPAADAERAEHLAELIAEAADQHDLDPRLILALAMRESSLSLRVERREVRGARGEVGLLQTHGVALRYRPDGCSTDLESAWCQLQTGARYLRAVRDHCGGSTWRWVASYGASRCLSESEAREDRAARVAHRLYLEIGGERWE